MGRHPSAWLGWLACCCLLVNCGQASSPVPLEDYCDRYTDMACGIADKCDCLGGISKEICQSYLLPGCEEDVEAPVEAGLMVYHPSEAGRCLAGLKELAADCSTDGDDEPEACDQFLTGALVLGAECEDDDTCQAGLECHSSVCTDMPGEGEACLEFGQCAENHFCGSDDLCHAYLSKGSSCADGEVCDDDLYCSPASATCKAFPGRGGDCADSGGDCAEDHYCDQAFTCQAQQPGGQACSEDLVCLSYECLDGTCTQQESDDICDHW